MQGKLGDPRIYFKVRTPWESFLCVGRGKRKGKKIFREDGQKRKEGPT